MRTKHLLLMFAILVGSEFLGFSNLALGQSEKQALAAYTKGDKLWLEGKYPEAIAELETALRLYRQLQGEASLHVAACYSSLGNVHFSMGQFAKSESMHRRCLDIHEAELGKNHPETANSLHNLGVLYLTMGQYAKSESYHRRSLDIFEAKLGKDHPATADALTNLAFLYQTIAQYAKAESLHRRSLDIYESKLGKDRLESATAINNLGLLYETMGQYALAESHYRRNLDIREAKLGKDHPDTATALNNLAGLYRTLGQYAKAEPLFRRSLDIYEIKLGKDHPATANSLNNLAGLYRDLGQLAKAETLLRRSLDICEGTPGVHPATARALNNLAFLYQMMKQSSKAEPLYLRSLDIREAKLGKDHPDTANSLGNLAHHYFIEGQYDKAEPLYRRSLDIREAKLGKDHPDTAVSFNDLAWLFASKKEWPKAIDLVHRARQGLANHYAQIMPVLSENEQLALIDTSVKRTMYGALSLGLVSSNGAVKSAEWLLNGKALGHQSLAEQHILARYAKEPQTKQMVDDLQNTRALRAKLLYSQAPSGLEKEFQQQVLDLRTREQDLEAKLARAVGRPYRANAWVSLEEVQSKLGAKAVFVDIARFDLIDFATYKSKGPRYAAWITPAKGDVQLIDLGDADVIDQLVEQNRKALFDSPKSIIAVGEREAVDELSKPLKELSAKVLHPLLPTLEKYEAWIISPDGALWLTPWNALLLKDGKYAIEKHRIRHVVSGRDLVQELPRTKADSASIFADPDFDLPPAKVMAVGGIRVDTSGIVGQRLRGTIGTWNVSFEFSDKEVTIRDEDSKSAIVGSALWKMQGDTLTMQTKISTFTGTINADAIGGERSVRNADGTLTRDLFRIDRPRGKSVEVRSVRSEHGVIPKVKRLRGTALEAEAIRPKLEQWLGQKPNVYLESEASEPLVKAVKNPRVLVLATHGYFFPTQEVETKDGPGLDLGDNKHRAILLDKMGQPIENPLLRCGLLLAGCNKRAEAKPGEDDGILTGLEIVGMNLQGCELVVLSACETGLGDVRNGEGVAGLRQAFQLAGAKGVLASLWQVPDRETALLMNAFYGELAMGKSQAEALRQAQLQRIAARHKQFGAAHPFFWAAFTLTNRGTE